MMAKKRSAYLIVLTYAAMLVLLQWSQLAWSHAPDRVWTVQRLADEMAKLGYKSQFVDARSFPSAYIHGLFLARATDTRSWEEITARRRTANALTWDGVVVVTRNPPEYVYDPAPEERRIGVFDFYGDPEEIERIARHFR
jgi:hypothetical protein